MHHPRYFPEVSGVMHSKKIFMNNHPMKKALKRSVRLPKAKLWLEIYSGKNIVRGYAKKFAVDKLCAVIELKMLGVDIPEAEEEQVKKAIENKRIQSLKLKQKRQEKLLKGDEYLFPESDYYYAYIAGCTSNGVPFGITHEQMDFENGEEIDEDMYIEMTMSDAKETDIEDRLKPNNCLDYDMESDLPF